MRHIRRVTAMGAHVEKAHTFDQIVNFLQHLIYERKV